MLRRCPHTTPTNMDFRVQSAISDIYPIAREVDFIELTQLLTVLFYSLYRQYTSRTRALCAGGTRFHAHMLPYRRLEQQVAILLAAAWRQCLLGS